MPDMLQSFLRMANLYNPQAMSNPAPTQLPTIKSPTMTDYSMPSYEPRVDEELTAYPEDSTLETFRQSVLHPPQRQHMTYPKSTLNGLTKALEIAAEPSPLAKNRVWVNGDAYQKQNVYTDPATGEKKFITNVHEPAFMDQVMRAMPAAVSGAIDIANQPFEDAKSDWDMKNKGLAAASAAESQMALAEQRRAQAGYYGMKGDIEQDKVDISRMTAEEKIRASQLNTLTDKQKLDLLQSGRVSLAELQAAAALKRVEEQQRGATERTNLQQTGANARTAAQQAGATQRVGMQQTGANQRSAAAIAARGNTPNPTQYPSQRKIALQSKAQQFINKNPNLSEFVTFNDQGFPVVSADAPEELQMEIYDALYGGTSKDVNLPAPGVSAPNISAPTQAPTPSQSTTPIKPVPSHAPAAAPGSSKMPPPVVKAAPGSPTLIPMITPDGKGVRMVPENQVQVALGQGYKYKTAQTGKK